MISVPSGKTRSGLFRRRLESYPVGGTPAVAVEGEWRERQGGIRPPSQETMARASICHPRYGTGHSKAGLVKAGILSTDGMCV